ncbi:hypothetical protein ACT3S9_15240 [Pseudoalteromonas sp. AOP31-A2-14]|uniref:hypothetical protein n=1 Tax=Pseudoalteromonas sp. AOP31-A2-14 TaxID=3457695 RepID=UPI003FB959D3
MTWYTKNLGDAMFADAELTQIKQSALGEHSLFVRYVAEYGLHCEVIVYFPPAAQCIAKKHSALACTKPRLTDLTLL